jgi:hypothetical protein
MTKSLTCANDCWQLRVATTTGDAIRLIDTQNGTERVFHAPSASGEVAEGGREKTRGLSLWVKTGVERDRNTGVLSSFAPIHNVPRTVRAVPEGIAVTAETQDLRFEITYTLPAGRQPLRISAHLTNIGATEADYQFEGFFQWFIAPDAWPGTAYRLPGLPPRWLFPFGELYFRKGDLPTPGAFWWQVGTGQGVAMRPLRGVAHFFCGVQMPAFILGPLGDLRRLTPGTTLTMDLELAPLSDALDRGWWLAYAETEDELRRDQATRHATARRLGCIADWCRRQPPAIARRAIHVTTQYGPAQTGEVLRLIEKLLAPCGFNEIVFEVGRNYRYRSHPRIAPDWAWDRAAWRQVLQGARDMGMKVIPQYNALAHMSESGLTRAYPELAEDPDGWCLNPEHPRVIACLRDLFEELIEVFECDTFHVGLDEVDVPSRSQSFALPKPGRTRDGGALFALHINNLYAILREHRQTMMMWADMLLYRPEHQERRGLRIGTWQAIAHIPRDIVMVDWIYHAVPDYGGSRYLQQHGFRVMGACWHTPSNIREWARAAVSYPLEGMMHTLWTPPRIRDVNVVCTLLAGRYFHHPDEPLLDATIQEAEALGLTLS